MSRSYPVKELDSWRMYCDACDFQDSDRFDKCPPLEHYASKGWFVGVKTDRCPDCYRAKGPHEKAHPVGVLFTGEQPKGKEQ